MAARGLRIAATALQSMLQAIDSYWRAPAPAERLAALRVLVGAFASVYLVARAGHLIGYGAFAPSMFRPVGVVAVLSAPLPAWVVTLQVFATLAASIAFVLGWRFRTSGPLFAVLLLWTLTYRNSFGMVFHTENLLVLHVVVLGVSAAADAWSADRALADRRSGSRCPPPAADGRYGWPIRLIAWVVVIAYLLAGIAKLRNGGLAWFSGEVLADHVAIDTARKMVLGSLHSPLAALVVDQPWMFRVFALYTLVVELGAPLALFGRRCAAVWVVMTIGFHLGVLALMLIAFPYPMSGIGLACFLPLERWGETSRQWLRRRRAPAA